MSSYTLDSDNETSEGHVIFVKNLNFDTNEDSLKEVIEDIIFTLAKLQNIFMQHIKFLIFDSLQLFSEAGKVTNVTIAKKKDSRNKGTVHIF